MVVVVVVNGERDKQKKAKRASWTVRGLVVLKFALKHNRKVSKCRPVRVKWGASCRCWPVRRGDCLLAQSFGAARTRKHRHTFLLLSQLHAFTLPICYTLHHQYPSPTYNSSIPSLTMAMVITLRFIRFHLIRNIAKVTAG